MTQLQLHTGTWMSFTKIMLIKRKHKQKYTHYKNLFLKHLETGYTIYVRSQDCC